MSRNTKKKGRRSSDWKQESSRSLEIQVIVFSNAANSLTDRMKDHLRKEIESAYNRIEITIKLCAKVIDNIINIVSSYDDTNRYSNIGSRMPFNKEKIKSLGSMCNIENLTNAFEQWVVPLVKEKGATNKSSKSCKDFLNNHKWYSIYQWLFLNIMGVVMDYLQGYDIDSGYYPFVAREIVMQCDEKYRVARQSQKVPLFPSERMFVHSTKHEDCGTIYGAPSHRWNTMRQLWNFIVSDVKEEHKLDILRQFTKRKYTAKTKHPAKLRSLETAYESGCEYCCFVIKTVWQSVNIDKIEIETNQNTNENSTAASRMENQEIGNNNNRATRPFVSQPIMYDINNNSHNNNINHNNNNNFGDFMGPSIAPSIGPSIGPSIAPAIAPVMGEMDSMSWIGSIAPGQHSMVRVPHFENGQFAIGLNNHGHMDYDNYGNHTYYESNFHNNNNVYNNNNYNNNNCNNNNWGNGSGMMSYGGVRGSGSNLTVASAPWHFDHFESMTSSWNWNQNMNDNNNNNNDYNGNSLTQATFDWRNMNNGNDNNGDIDNGFGNSNNNNNNNDNNNNNNSNNNVGLGSYVPFSDVASVRSWNENSNNGVNNGNNSDGRLIGIERNENDNGNRNGNMSVMNMDNDCDAFSCISTSFTFPHLCSFDINNINNMNNINNINNSGDSASYCFNDAQSINTMMPSMAIVNNEQGNEENEENEDELQMGMNEMSNEAEKRHENQNRTQFNESANFASSFVDPY